MKNKKIISAVISLSMMLTSMSGFAAKAYDENASLMTTLTEQIVVGSETAEETAVSYELTISKDGMLITVIYDSEGKILKTELDAVTAGAKQKTITSTGDNKQGMVKFMLWSSVNEITPLSAYVSKEWKMPTVVKVMPLGDSITDGFNIAGGYRNTLEASINTAGISKWVDFVGSQTKGTGYDNNHEGHSGWAIDAIAKADDIEGKGRSGLSPNINNWMNTYKPEVVLLMIGTNDILSQYKLDEAQTRLQSLADKISAGLPEGGKVYIATIPYISISANYNKTGIKDQSVMNAQVDTYNQAVRAVAQNSGFELVDVNAALTLTDLADGIHPNAGGYTKLGNLWYNTIIDELNSRI